MHELGHHVDQWNETYEQREKFANDFVRKYGKEM